MKRVTVAVVIALVLVATRGVATRFSASSPAGAPSPVDALKRVATPLKVILLGTGTPIPRV